MSAQQFKIRRGILIPFGISAGLLLCLFVLALLVKGSAVERLVLAGITLIVLALFILAQDRRITINDRRLLIRKYFRTKEIRLEEISHVGCLVLRKRVYLLLTTSRGFIIFSNAYDAFSTLVRNIISHIEPEKVEDEVRTLAEGSKQKRTDVISLWFAVVVISGLIILKLSLV